MAEVKQIPFGDGDYDYVCEKCGSSEVEWFDCDECEDGYSDHDCGEDTCACKFPINNVVCSTCDGEAGWWRCFACERTRDAENAC